MDVVDDSKEGMLTPYHDNKSFKTAEIYSGLSTNVLSKAKLGTQENIVTIFETNRLQRRSCLRDCLKRLSYLIFVSIVICLLVVILCLNLNKQSQSYSSEEVGALYQLSNNISKKLHFLRIEFENSQKKVPSDIEDILSSLKQDLHESETNLQPNALTKVQNKIAEELRLLETSLSSRQSPRCRAGWGPSHDIYGDDTDFYLAFRATAGTGLSVYDTYRGDGLKVNLEPSCRQVNSSLACSGHYRNDVILDTWQNIHQVVIGLYRGGHLVQSLKFKAAGSNYLTWMSPERLIHAGNWQTQLTSSSENHEFWKSNSDYFNIEGDGGMKRRFFISETGGDCDQASGWMAVLDPRRYDRRPCSWEMGGERPTFLYSQTSGSSTWENVGHADVMAVFVKPFDECID